MKKTGVVLIALGHKSYGEMACSLAAAIAATAKLPVIVYHDAGMEKTLKEKSILFDEMRLLDDKYYALNGRINYTMPKVYLNELTPFKETLYLDVDTILFPKTNLLQLLYSFKEIDFTIANYGYHISGKKAGYWGDPEAIKKAYSGVMDFDSGRLYSSKSEFIYFKESIKNTAFFKAAQTVFTKPKIQPFGFNGATMPDEFAFNIAMNLLHHYPHEDSFQPFYDPHIHPVIERKKVLSMNQYIGMSIGYNQLSEEQKNFYDALSKIFNQQAGFATYCKARDKRDYLKERLAY